MATQAVPTNIRSKNTGNVAINPSEATQEKLLKHAQNCMLFLNGNFNLRESFLQRDLAYYREKSFSKEGIRAAYSNVTGDSTKIRDVIIPVVMPQVETQLAYLTEVFLTGYPIFPLVSKPQMQEPAIQMETTVGDHSVRFGWAAQLEMTLRDGLKYNLMACEVEWRMQRVWSIETDEKSTESAAKAPVETYYQGNVIEHLDMYNTILDTRVKNPSRHHIEAEFGGYTKLYNRVQLKQLIADLGSDSTMNAKKAFESGGAVYSFGLGKEDYYIPQLNPFSFDRPNPVDSLTTTNWLAWAGEESKDGIKYNNMYEVTKLYIRIIPNDYDLNVAGKNNVQIWKLYIVNRKVIIFCERQTNAHNFIPIIVGQPTEDGLGYQTKSLADNAVPFQDAATALFTSGLESQRRKVYDRIFYDPSRINKKDIDNTSSAARIPIKQSAYGQPLNTAVYMAPYHDEGVGLILQMSGGVSDMADKANGQNRAQQGQFQKGNKSRKEFETIMGNANGRGQAMAIKLEYNFFQPIKEIIKLNILQFQPPTKLYNRNTNTEVQINPADLRTASLEFKLADGVLPVEKMVNLEGLGTVLQMSATNPAIAADYDIVGATMYAMIQGGANWLSDFRRTPEEKTAYMQNIQATSGVTNAVGQPIAPTAGPT